MISSDHRVLRRAASLVAAVGSLLCATTLASQYALVDSDVELLQRAEAARQIGDPSADVTVDEFFDFACPDCMRFHIDSSDRLQAMVESQNLLFTARIYPIPRLMRGFQAAEAALCVGAFLGSEGFLRMQDQLFSNQDAWRGLLDPTPLFEIYAERAGAPMRDFRACVARDAMAPLILNDVNAARAAGVTSTPTFVFNPVGTFTGRFKATGSDAIDRFQGLIRNARQRR